MNGEHLCTLTSVLHKDEDDNVSMTTAKGYFPLLNQTKKKPQTIEIYDW